MAQGPKNRGMIITHPDSGCLGRDGLTPDGFYYPSLQFYYRYLPLHLCVCVVEVLVVPQYSSNSTPGARHFNLKFNLKLPVLQLEVPLPVPVAEFEG